MSDGSPPRPGPPEPPPGPSPAPPPPSGSPPWPGPPPPRPDRPFGPPGPAEGPGHLEPTEEPPRPRWTPLEALPVLLIAFLLVAVLGSLATALTSSCASRYLVQLAAGELAFPLAVILWVRLVSHSSLAALGAPRNPIGDVGTGVVGGLALVGVGFVAGAVVLTVARLILGHPPSQPEQISACVTGGAFVASGFGVVLLAPLCEETFFRGFLYRGLRGRFSVWPSALISAAAFALVHVDPLLIFSLFPVGIGLALVYERRQSLLASVVAHATFNLIGIIVIAMSR